MSDQRSGDRHTEQPLTVRFGPDRPRLEDYAKGSGRRIRTIVREAVRDWLDKHETTETTGEQS